MPSPRLLVPLWTVVSILRVWTPHVDLVIFAVLQGAKKDLSFSLTFSLSISYPLSFPIPYSSCLSVPHSVTLSLTQFYTQPLVLILGLQTHVGGRPWAALLYHSPKPPICRRGSAEDILYESIINTARKPDAWSGQ